MPTQLSDVIVPQEFTAYQIQNSMVSTAFYQSGVLVPNAEISSQLQTDSQSFTVPFWNDLPDAEADITNDDPTDFATPQKLTANKQIVRKSFLHESWSAMSFASELAGSNPLEAFRTRIQASWDRQFEKRLFATLNGVLTANKTNDTPAQFWAVSG